MRTIVFQYNDSYMQQLVFSAHGSTPFSEAIECARVNMPAGADKFRVVTKNGRTTSGWIR